MTIDTTTFFAQRRALLRSALERLIEAHSCPLSYCRISISSMTASACSKRNASPA